MNDDHSNLKAQEYDKGHGITKSWYVGLPMMLIGVVFLIINFTQFTLNNWWALFFLIPIGFILMNAITSRDEDGRLTRSSRSTLVGALFMGLLMFVFLLNLDWTKIWPLFLIASGMSFIIGRWNN